MKMEDHTPAVGCLDQQGIDVRSIRTMVLVADQSISFHDVCMQRVMAEHGYRP